MLVHIKDIVKKAKKGGYAIGAFNIHSIESVLGVAQAAVRAKSPAIIQVSESTIDYMGAKPITHIVSTVAKNVASNVPIALHLDHGTNFTYISECINAGFSSIHADASAYPLDENIVITKDMVEIAHSKGVWVQAEIGSIMGGHGNIGGKISNIPLADPGEVAKLIKATGIDTVAAAIGTAHGAFENEDIHFDLLRDIAQNTKIPLVLHGGSGVKDKDILKAISYGIRIVNIGTDIKAAFSKTLIENCLKNRDETDPRKLLKPTIKAVEDVVYAKMRLFGSAGKA
jgi:ketose-bisphosphate aldolase